MDYSKACGILKDAARRGSRPGLDTITRLCALLGNPQDQLKIIHVAGTNGKGSTCRMLSAIGTAAGYKTGVFASPFFKDYRESFFIDGAVMPEDDFARVVAIVHAKARIMEKEGQPPTEFELLTACAFVWFSGQNCSLVVLETGMGGRLDSTNVIGPPLACVITAIALDHAAFLGETVLEIAAEKCGIIKEGSLVVAYPGQPPGVLDLIKKAAAEKNCPFVLPRTDGITVMASSLEETEFTYKDTIYTTGMPGAHQVLNAAVALETAHALTQSAALLIPNSAITTGLALARLPARQEVLGSRPPVLLDGAHNPHGIKALAQTVKTHLKGRRIIVVMGMLSDKQYKQSVVEMARLCVRFIAATPESPRALKGEFLAQEAKRILPDVSACASVGDALAEALEASGPDGAVVVCGSFYLALAARRLLLGEK